MIFIHIIIAFLLGIVFVQWLIPIVDGIINLFLTWLEVEKGRMAVKITKYQEQASAIKEKDNNKTSAIGFSIVEEEEEEDYNDE